MPIVFVWGSGKSPVVAALGQRARVRDLDARAREVAAEAGDYDVPAGSEHGITPRWAHALEVEDMDDFAESIRDDTAIVEWCPEDEDA